MSDRWQVCCEFSFAHVWCLVKVALGVVEQEEHKAWKWTIQQQKAGLWWFSRGPPRLFGIFWNSVSAAYAIIICLIIACFRICEEWISNILWGYGYNYKKVVESNDNVTNTNKEFIKAALILRVKIKPRKKENPVGVLCCL